MTYWVWINTKIINTFITFVKNITMRNLNITTLPTVKEGWVDRDMIMLHACFQLLTDFVEKEDGLVHSNYVEHKETIDELTELYTWWKSSYTSVTIDDVVADENLARLVKHRSFLWT